MFRFIRNYMFRRRMRRIMPYFGQSIDVPFDKENSLNVASVKKPLHPFTGKPLVGEYVINFEYPYASADYYPAVNFKETAKS